MSEVHLDKCELIHCNEFNLLNVDIIYIYISLHIWELDSMILMVPLQLEMSYDSMILISIFHYFAAQY